MDIDWEIEPTGFDNNVIRWEGKCLVCKREVYEIYSQQEELWDAETNEEI